MHTNTLSAKWFILYFALLGILLIGSGIFLILKKKMSSRFILEATTHEKPPRLLVRILKYLLLFTLPGLVLSFMPFSWIELLFTLWSLLLVYIAGIQLVRWDERRAVIKSQAKDLPNVIRRSGAIMVAVGSALLLLAYWVIKQASF
ncbi:MAG TPA: hypothetical protein VJ964_17970 [Balneolaceae bacterium]|nr:hypothetical protein [Balneolaceae bacterium]